MQYYYNNFFSSAFINRMTYSGSSGALSYTDMLFLNELVLVLDF